MMMAVAGIQISRAPHRMMSGRRDGQAGIYEAAAANTMQYIVADTVAAPNLARNNSQADIITTREHKQYFYLTCIGHERALVIAQ
jgi:hypothetical protein